MAESLLVELLTEELPPKSLRQLGSSFAASIRDELVAVGLVAKTVTIDSEPLATPRRLAVLIPAVSKQAPAKETEVVGPPVAAPEAAAAGFAKKHGLAPELLGRRTTAKGEFWVARVKAGGVSLEAVLAGIVEKALKKLPIPKVMRWGSGDEQFVRPVHGLVMLHGKSVVPGTVLGLRSQRSTKGHRFLGKGHIALKQAADYVAALAKNGIVVVPFGTRRSAIEKQLREQSKKLGASLGAAQEIAFLLDEVTALVEHPSVHVGAFDPSFLEIPQECLILTMRQNQKYFPLFDGAGKLLPKFLIVSNMKVADPKPIVAGNERVVRARLEDARFFYDQDRRTKLEDRVPELARVVYHSKLDTQLDRVERIGRLAELIGQALKADAAQVKRAAYLCKADLPTGMVGEFPELQGTMGRYYALHDGEGEIVAGAIEGHYRPRFSNDSLPAGPVACAVALADKLDAIAGMFSIGQQPTGEKDPFGLRRAALGIVRIIAENKLPLSLNELADAAFAPFKSKAPVELIKFVNDRFASYLKDLGFSTLQVDAVLSRNRMRPGLVPSQLEAVKAFQALPEAESLAAANKRVANILKQAEAKGEVFANAEQGELKEPAERALHEAIRSTSQKAKALFDRGDYTGYLTTFSVLKAPVDAFFNSVRVMDDDPAIRRGRLALLHDLREAMNRVADISKLAA